MKNILVIFIITCISTSTFSDDMPMEVKRLKTLRDKKVEEVDKIYLHQLEKLKKKYAAAGDIKSAMYIETMLIAKIDTDKQKEGIDITDRNVTDPLLKIISNKKILPANDKLFTKVDPTEVTIQEDRTPKSYKELWGEEYVLVVHPFNKTTPGSIDFSEITSSHKGALKLKVRNYPNRNHDIKIIKGTDVVDSKSIDGNNWKSFRIKFDNQPVKLEIHASGWMNEDSFITYEIEI